MQNRGSDHQCITALIQRQTLVYGSVSLLFFQARNQNYKTKAPRETFQHVIITNQHENQEFPAGSKEAHTFYRLV